MQMEEQAGKCQAHTEEWDARWVSRMERFSVLAEVLGITHELPHSLESGVRLRRHYVPGSL